MSEKQTPTWVVIPAYNAVNHIGRAVRSAVEHSGATQVLVIDDESKDGTGGAAERAGARVVTQRNGGPGAARNRGFDLAHEAGADVLTLDADDEFLPGAGAAVREALKRRADTRVLLSDYNRRGYDRCEDLSGALGRALRAMQMRPVAALLPSTPITASGLWVSHRVIGSGLRFDRSMFTAEDRDFIYRAYHGSPGPLAMTERPVFVKHEVRGQMTADPALSERFLRDVLHLVEKHGGEIEPDDRRSMAPMVQYYLKRACRLAAWRGEPFDHHLWQTAAAALRTMGERVHWRTWKWYYVARVSGLAHGRWRHTQAARA